MALDRIMAQIRKHPQAWYYVILAVASCAMFAAMNGYLIVTGREGVWTQDHRSMYVNYLVWGIQTFTSAVSQAATGQGFNLPMYTYSIGYGADVPVAFGSYLQDPLNIVALLFPTNMIGFSYTLMSLVRVILAAFAFSLYCFNRGHGRKATGIASLAYICCGFIFLLGVMRHPKFLDWAILMPLMLCGADKIFKGKSGALFTVSLTLEFIVSMYYSYMSCVVLLVYCLIKYFFSPRERSVSDFLLLVGKFLAYGVLAFLISAALSLPQIVALLSQGRATSGKAIIPLLFGIKYYAKIPAHLIGADGTTNGLMLTGVVTIAALIFVICRKYYQKDDRRPWLIGLALCVLGILFPFFGHVMNGMGYSTDRWMLMLGFICAYILCLTLPQFGKLKQSDWKHVGIGVGVLSAITAIYGVLQIFMPDGMKASIWPIAMAIVFVLAFLVLKRVAAKKDQLRTAIACATTMIVCTALTSAFFCSPIGMDWAERFPASGQTWANIMEKSPAAAMDQIEDDEPHRYTLPRVFNLMKNSPLNHNQMGIDYYTSYYAQSVDDFRQELGISDHYKNYSFVGSDSRLAIESFCGAKYYICKERDFWRVPYGYEDVGIEYQKYHVFKNDNVAPFAFLAPSAMKSSDYSELTMAQKQETLLQCAVIDDEEIPTDVAVSQPQFASQEIPYKVTETNGLTIEDGLISTTKEEATLTLEFEGLANSETYLSLEGLSFHQYTPIELAQANGKSVGLKTRIRDILRYEPTTYMIVAGVGENTKSIENATTRNPTYGGKLDWIFNLCYREEPVTSMTVTFNTPGEYTFSDMKIVCQPVEPVAENTKALAGNALDNLQLGTNKITADVELDADETRIAVFTFADTGGWSAKVDGAEAEELTVDTAFIGVPVSGKGTHTIELTYVTPGLKPGTLLTAAGVVLAIIGIVVSRLRKRKVKSQTAPQGNQG